LKVELVRGWWVLDADIHGFFASSVEEEVALGYRAFKGEEGVRGAVELALERVGLDYGSFKDRTPFYLSQGEKRLCAIASVLVFSPELCLLDEPALFLDGKARKGLISTLNGLSGTGTALIIVSHDREFLDDVTGKIIELKGNLCGVCSSWHSISRVKGIRSPLGGL
jgi:energy-coupling factor transport system ATP-binding protein